MGWRRAAGSGGSGGGGGKFGRNRVYTQNITHKTGPNNDMRGSLGERAKET